SADKSNGAEGEAKHGPPAPHKYDMVEFEAIRALDLSTLRQQLFPANPKSEEWQKKIDEIVMHTIEGKWNDLVEIFASDLAYMPTDSADPRALEPINKGDPVNIIVSKVYVSDNDCSTMREWLGYPRVAVLLEVVDGSGEPRRLVAAVADR